MPDSASAARRLRSQQDTIVELGLLCASEHSLDELLHEASRLVRQALDADFTKVLERRRNGSLLVRAGDGWPDGVVGTIEIPPGGDSQASAALRANAPVIVTDLPGETRFTPWQPFLDLGVRSGVNVVIRAHGRPYGVLEANAREQRQWDRDDVNFLQSAANLLGVALERQQYEEERDHIINLTSHELRNPLSIVLGYAQRVRRRLQAGTDLPRDELIEAVESIYSGARSMQRLLDTLMQLAQVEEGVQDLEPDTPLADVIEAVMAQMRELYPATVFRTDISAAVAGLLTQEEMAQMLIANIVENAAKYSRLQPEVTVTLEPGDGTSTLRVRDRCGGLPSDDLDRIFDRYFRGESAGGSRGLGLGLFIALRAADALGWRVGVDNFPGEGCEFHVTIPRRLTPA